MSSDNNNERMDVATEAWTPKISTSVPVYLSDVVLNPHALPSTMPEFGWFVYVHIINKFANNAVPGVKYDSAMVFPAESKPHVIHIQIDKDYAETEIGLKKAQYGINEVAKIVATRALLRLAEFPVGHCTVLGNYEFLYGISPKNPYMYDIVVKYHELAVPII